MLCSVINERRLVRKMDNLIILIGKFDSLIKELKSQIKTLRRIPSKRRRGRLS